MLIEQDVLGASSVARKAAYFDALAPQRDVWKRRNIYYHQQIEAICSRTIPPGSKVLELGCGTGDLLAALQPAYGVGVDLSRGMVTRARQKYPQYSYLVGDVKNLPIDETFDYVVMSDVVGHLDDIWETLNALHRVMRPDSRLVITYYNFVWEGLLRFGEQVGWKMPQQHQNWLGMQDIASILSLTNFAVESSSSDLLLPVEVPFLSDVINSHLASQKLFSWACLLQSFVVRPVKPTPSLPLSVSVIVPCRNELGNIADAVRRTPAMGCHTEIIFVDGSSTDGTVEEIERQILAHPELDIKLIHQVPPGIEVEAVAGGTAAQPKMLKLGKGDAVRKGFDAAEGEVLMILDADLTVPPEDLPKFYAALAEQKGHFVNGSRLVYPLEDEAMPFVNYIGNKIFSWLFTWLLEQPIKDTLCGTKVLLKADYEKIKAGRAYFGDFDPFGDFDLLFGAARQKLPIVEVPVRYRKRQAGYSKVTAYRHGWLLLRMCTIAFWRLKLPKWRALAKL